MKDRTRARTVAEFNRRGDPTHWFDILCREGWEGKNTIPAAGYYATPHLVGCCDPASSNRQRPSVEDLELLFDLLPEVNHPNVRPFRVPFWRVKLQVSDRPPR
ncbi:MAG TPA: hypothetical protein VM709_03465 [Candidatus Sulfotelmatobacter sp.]|nr:hypothetical protein [Candidatus Sulfotelmatobacter sp.]